MDSQVAQGLVRVVQAARLLGTDVALVGIRPEVAQTIVGLGLDLSRISTHSDLQGRTGIRQFFIHSMSISEDKLPMNRQYSRNRLTATELLSIFEQNPVAMSLYDHTGLQVAMNAANAALFELNPDEWIGTFNMVTDPQLRSTGSHERHQRVMAGETLVIPPHPFSARASGHQDDAADERWVEATYLPLRDAEGQITHLLALLRDVTNQIAQHKAIEAAQAEIMSQQVMIESLSTPVVQVWEGMLAMPLVGIIDSSRAMRITESLLIAIAQQQAECVIIDITGVPVVDTRVAQYLLQAAKASKLLGCDVALVGIGAEIAQALVQLGVDFQTLTTMANFQAGIAWAFARRGMTVINTV